MSAKRARKTEENQPQGADRNPPKGAKKKTFSVVSAVKANARERVGQPKPERILPDAPREQRRGRKHPQTLADLLGEKE